MSKRIIGSLLTLSLLMTGTIAAIQLTEALHAWVMIPIAITGQLYDGTPFEGTFRMKVYYPA